MKRYLIDTLLFVWGLLILNGCGKSDNDLQESIPKEVQEVIDHAGHLIDSGEFTLAISLLDSTFFHLQHLPKEAHLEKLKMLSGVYFHQLRLDSISWLYLDSIEELLGNGNDRASYRLHLCFMRGQLTMRQRRFNTSLYYFHRAKTIIDSLGEPCSAREFYYQLSIIHYRQQRYREALEYMHQELDHQLYCPKNDTIVMVGLQQRAFNTIGLCYEHLNLQDSAIYYYSKGIQAIDAVIQKYPNEYNQLIRFKGVLLGNMGSAYFRKKQYALAELQLRSAIAINASPSREIKDAILNQVKLADVMRVTGRMNECATLIQVLDSLNRKYYTILSSYRIADLKAKYYLALNNFQAANANLMLSIAYEDSLELNGDIMQGNRDYMKELRSLEKELELVKLQKNSRTQALYVLLLTSLIGIVTVIGFLLIRRRKLQEQYIKDLQSLNNRINDSNFQLVSSLENLQRSEEELKRILRIVVHDLRSPITGILGLARLMRANELDESEKQNAVQLIEESGEKAIAFIDEVLNAHHTGAPMEKTDLAVILQSCIQLVQPQIARKKQQLHQTVLSVYIMAYPEKVWSIFNNLISNAVKFTPEDGTIGIEMEVTSTHVLVTVSDNGIGIPQDQVEAVFDLLNTEGRMGTSGEKSHGLGLALAKQMIDQHNGSIQVKSSETGTRFTVILPRI